MVKSKPLKTLELYWGEDHPDYKTAIFQMRQSNKLYNRMVYVTRQRFFHYLGREYNDCAGWGLKEWVGGDGYNGSLYDLTSLVANKDFMAGITLNTHVAKGVVLVVATAWRSFFALKEIQSNRQIPGYRKKGDLFVVEYVKPAISQSLKNSGKVVPTPTEMTTGSELPEWFLEGGFEVQHARVKFKNNRVCLQVTYIDNENRYEKTKGEKIAGIDFGVNNLCTIAFDDKISPRTVSGRKIKSINQFANKEVARLKRELPKNIYSSDKIRQIYGNRNLQILREVHEITNRIVDLLVSRGVGTLVLGKM